MLGAVAACDAPPADKAPAQPTAQEKPAAPALSQQQIDERSAQCTEKSRGQFRRDWKDGTVSGADGRTMIAAFASHYNAKLDTCFYLLTVNRPANQDSAAAGTFNRMLFDINDGEQYGEYLGPAGGGSPATGLPATCRIESMYCASEREWEVLVSAFMED